MKTLSFFFKVFFYYFFQVFAKSNDQDFSAKALGLCSFAERLYKKCTSLFQNTLQKKTLIKKDSAKKDFDQKRLCEKRQKQTRTHSFTINTIFFYHKISESKKPFLYSFYIVLERLVLFNLYKWGEKCSFNEK
jgi:hypothetical protein